MSGIKITGAKQQIDRLQRIADAANASVMRKTMFFLKERIILRTESGEFLNGSNKDYSKAGALYKISSQALKREYKSRMTGANTSYQMFGKKGKKYQRRGIKKDQSTANYVYLENGYFQYRNIHGRQTNYVDLNYNGIMLARMNDIQTKPGYASLGFREKKQEQKARWLSEMGAGKNKIKYEFFGMSEADKDAVTEKFDEELTDSLKELGVI